MMQSEITMQSRINMSKETKKSISQKGSILKYSVGIDVGKENIDTCISKIDTEQKVTVVATRSFSNSIKGFESFNNWFSR
jgi:hypothetical protein